MNDRLRPIALLGGTFDPVHHGHLRLALECLERLEAQQLRLIPAARPPHRATPGGSPEARLAMLQLAVAGQPDFVVDDRELRRRGPSYTVDTLIELRRELGPQVPLLLLLGLDAFLGLPSWHRADELLTLAHLVVVHRPGWPLPSGDAPPLPLLREAAPASAAAIAEQPHGRVWHLAVPALEISASAIRELCRSGRSPRWLLPDEVGQYIAQHRIYCVNATRNQ